MLGSKYRYVFDKISQINERSSNFDPGNSACLETSDKISHPKKKVQDLIPETVHAWK